MMDKGIRSSNSQRLSPFVISSPGRGDSHFTHVQFKVQAYEEEEEEEEEGGRKGGGKREGGRMKQNPPNTHVRPVSPNSEVSAACLGWREGKDEWSNTLRTLHFSLNATASARHTTGTRQNDNHM